MVPEEKLASILSKVRDLIEAKRVPVRVVASVYAGKPYPKVAAPVVARAVATNRR